MRRFIVARVVYQPHPVHELPVCQLLHRLGSFAGTALDLLRKDTREPQGNELKRGPAKDVQVSLKEHVTHMRSIGMPAGLFCPLLGSLVHHILVGEDEEDL